MKKHLKTLSPLAKSVSFNALFYLSINPVVVRSSLVKGEAKVQVSIYYVSNVLLKVEINYLEIGKYLCTLVVSITKFCLYFHVYDSIVLTNQTLKHFLQKLDTVGRMIKRVV